MCLGGLAMPGITATIITFNEEDRIAEAMASLACCDEIIVVDSGSTDRTLEIAAAQGARVITHAWEGYSNQKNFAAGQSRHDWILSLDADERLSMELADEIVQWKKEQNTFAAFSMPRRAFYLGRWINHSGWYPDRKLRLYDRRRCLWKGEFVHERVEVDGSVGRLGGDLVHVPYRSWDGRLARVEKYTELAAEAARLNGRRGGVPALPALQKEKFGSISVDRGGQWIDQCVALPQIRSRGRMGALFRFFGSFAGTGFHRPRSPHSS